MSTTGRFAVVMNTAPIGQAGFVFWQRGHGDPYLFDTRAEAYRVFREQCDKEDFKGPLGWFRYWVVDLSEDGVHVYTEVKKRA